VGSARAERIDEVGADARAGGVEGDRDRVVGRTGRGALAGERVERGLDLRCARATAGLADLPGDRRSDGLEHRADHRDRVGPRAARLLDEGPVRLARDEGRLLQGVGRGHAARVRHEQPSFRTKAGP
jgi:hypothetical protein